MSSSQADLPEIFHRVDYGKVTDAVADAHNQDSTTIEALCSEKDNNVVEGSEDAENMLPSSPACENAMETEIVIEENLDGLYSWVIVCASFLNCFISGTMFVGFSILYVEISEYFGSSKGAAGWIGSLHIACGKASGEKCHNLY